jgi:hypothetical protein
MEAQVAASSLYVADVGAMQIAPFGQIFLGDSQILPESANRVA